MTTQPTVVIHKKEMKRCVLFTLAGRFDSSTARQLEEALQLTLNAGHFNLVLNMAGVEYMSSAALRVLISTAKECRKTLNGGDLRLAAVSPRVQQVLDLAGLDTLFQSFESEVEAVGSF
ncbi:MAG: STAS domain-containing protein [Caldilineales bacterium]|nr:STAS domain-containing protein [Caldilineales bacterium]